MKQWLSKSDSITFEFDDSYSINSPKRNPRLHMFNSANCAVCGELRLIENLVKRRKGYKCPGCLGLSRNDSYIQINMLADAACHWCGQIGQVNDFFRVRNSFNMGPKTKYKCITCRKGRTVK